MSLLLPALRGVRAAHRCGVIHRDLKPANVFLCRDDAGEPLTAKVLDFGVSKIVTDTVDGEDPSLTDSGALLGTPRYAAPEQLEQARRADQRADVYASGAILYHALAGRPPFEAESYAKLVVEVMTSQPVPLERIRPDLSPVLCAIVERAMQRDLELRFATMDELIAALEAVVDPERRGAERPRPRTRERLTWFGVAMLVAIGLATWWSRHAATRSVRAPAAAAAAVAPGRVPAAPIAAPAPAPAPAPEIAAGAAQAEATQPLAPDPRVGPPRPARRTRPAFDARARPARSEAARAQGSAPDARPGAIIELSGDDF